MTRCLRVSAHVALFLILLSPAALTYRASASGRVGATVLALSPHPHYDAPPDRRIFERAAARTGVPASLLMAISYVQSRWGDHGGTASVDGGYGLMDLGRGPGRDTLGQAARLLHVSPARLTRDDALNVLGGALLMARDARSLSPRHMLPRTLGDWAPAVVMLTGMRTAIAAQAVSRAVYGVLAHGIPPSGATGGIRPLAAIPNLSLLAPRLLGPRGGSANDAEYPGAIWAPSPNYTAAQRPRDLGVSYAVIHDTEGSCASALNWLDSPLSRGSAHFLVCQDGTVYQLVRIRDIAWHAGNWYINQHSIGIEHEGYRDSGGYTQAQYDASAAIIQWLDTTYGLSIAPDRTSIFGHENVPEGGHTDPGALWDWDYYMRQVRGGMALDSSNVTIAAIVAPEVTFYACPDPSCTVIGTANWGEQYAMARSSNGWDEVYYNGAAAWAVAEGIAAGTGQRLAVTIARLNVRSEPDYGGDIIGTIPRGQIYVSRVLDQSCDPEGWWLIAYNHRYGFVVSRYVQPLDGAPVAIGTATVLVPTPIVTARPTKTATATATLTATPTASATATASTTATITATSSVTPVVTATGVASVTVTPTATLTATATPAITPTATASAMPSPSATNAVSFTATATDIPTASPSRTPRPAPGGPPRPMRLLAMVVSVMRPQVRLHTPFRLRVHTSAAHARVRYMLTLPAGVTLRASGLTDARGDAQGVFLVPGDSWLHAILVGEARARHRRTLPPPPHSVGGVYTVTASWRGHTLVRHGTFRVVLWK